MNYRRVPLVLIFLAATATTSASPQGFASQQNIAAFQLDLAAIQQDPRLSKLVSLSTRAMPLRAVLDTMAAQTGVTISTDDLDAASGYAVFANYERVPVGTIMNGLYGLFSINRGEWSWIRRGKPGAYAYTLQETSWAKNRKDIYNGLLMGMLETYLTALRDLAPMKMADRKLHRQELQKALMLDDAGGLQTFFESELFWDQAKFFLNALSQDQQAAVLAGTSVSVELKTLPPEVYDLYHQYYLTHIPTLTASGAASVQDPEPETVRFYRSNAGPESAMFAPSIFLASSHGGITWMGTGLLQFGILHAIRRAWTLPGDSTTDPASRRVVSETQDTDEIRKEKSETVAEAARAIDHAALPEETKARITASLSSSLTLGLTLQQLSAGSSTPVLAVIAATDRNMIKSPVGKPIQDFLDKLEPKDFKRRFYKWRGGILLVNHPYWFIEPTRAMSYAQLRTLQPDSRGDVLLTAWIKLMSSITDSQAAWFAATYNIYDMNRIRQCLVALAIEPGIMHTDGVSTDNSSIRYLQSVSLVPYSLKAADTGARVRIIVSTSGAPTLAKKALQVEVFDPLKKEWARSGMVNLPVLQARKLVVHQ